MGAHAPYDQAGLETVPEPEAPQVVERQFEKLSQWNNPNHTQYQQPAPAGNGQYPQFDLEYHTQSAYPESNQPGSRAYWPAENGVSKPPDVRICGIQRRIFWLIVGPFLAILVIGLAVGLGVGLGTKKSDSATATSSSSATPTSTSSSATSTSTSNLACPGSDGTTYAASNNDKFTVLCGTDYNGNDNGGTVELESVDTSSVEVCADDCASNSSCVGAGWGYYNGVNTCWLKSKLGTSQSATSGWFFLIRQ